MTESKSRRVFSRVVPVFLVGIWMAAATQRFIAPPLTPAADTGDIHTPGAFVTLVRPNGGEVWEPGTEQSILWAYSGLAEDVRLEYSTNGAQTWQIIVSATSGPAGQYKWMIPNESSNDVYVRVTGILDASLSDISDAPFSIFSVRGFEDAFVAADPAAVNGGDVVTYTIQLYEAESATMMLTDTLPSPLDYVTNSLRVTPDWKNPAQFEDGAVRWADLVTQTVPVSITFRAQVQATGSTFAVANTVLVSRNAADPVELAATVIVNGFSVNLPIVLKD